MIAGSGEQVKPPDGSAVLSPAALDYLRDRGVSEATREANGVHMARPCDLARLAGRPVPDGTSALVFPYPVPDGEAPFYRMRWLPPLRDREGHEVKFTQPPGTAPRLYVLPSVRSVLADPGVPLLVVEGETRALVLVQHGRPAIAIGGLWSWMVDGRPIADLDAIAWVDREVTSIPDSDVWTRPDLLQPVFAFGKELECRGAKVKVAVLRPAPDGGKRGLDDLVAAEGPGALDALAAIPLRHKAFTHAAAWWKGWRAKKDEAADGSPEASLGVADVGHWPEPVDGARLLDDLAEAARRFVALPKYGDTAVALWIAAAHAFDAFDTFPFLALVSPIKRCGKTTLIKVLARLLPRALAASNVSAASVYRIIEAERPSLLLDEGDTFTRDNEELRGVLNSGHTRDTAYVIRVEGEGENRRAVRLSTWCPRAFALIGSLPDTLDDRSITIPMRRRTKTEAVARARRKALERLRDLARVAARWAADHAEALAAADPAVPEALDDRAADNWAPPLAVADLAGGDWPHRARAAALALSGGRDAEDDGPRVRLLRNIKAVYDRKQVGRLSSADLAADLAADGEWGWATWAKGRPLNQRGLARLLAPFSIKPRVIRVGDDTPSGYMREWFIDAWARYLGSDPQHPQQAQDDGGLSPLSVLNKPPGVEDAKPPLSPEEQSVVEDVEDERVPSGAGAQLDASEVVL